MGYPIYLLLVSVCFVIYVFFIVFVFFLHSRNGGGLRPKPRMEAGEGLRLQTPRGSWKHIFYWVGVASAAYPQLRRLRTCFIIFVKSQKRNIFLGGVASAAYPLLRKPSLMFYRFFQSRRSGGGLCPKPRAEALSSDPWGHEGGKKG